MNFLVFVANYSGHRWTASASVVLIEQNLQWTAASLVVLKEAGCSLSHHEQGAPPEYRLIFSISAAARSHVHLTECACVKVCSNSSDTSNADYFRVL